MCKIDHEIWKHHCALNEMSSSKKLKEHQFLGQVRNNKFGNCDQKSEKCYKYLRKQRNKRPTHAYPGSLVLDSGTGRTIAGMKRKPSTDIAEDELVSLKSILCHFSAFCV